jgi:hypothetical protein
MDAESDRARSRGDWFPMPQRPGAHGAYVRANGALVVEWYDFGDHAPYESATLLVFDAVAQTGLARALGLPADLSAQQLAAVVAERFASYFDVLRYAEDKGLAFVREVDFQP